MMTTINHNVLKIAEATANEARLTAFHNASSYSLFTPGPENAKELQAQQSILLSMCYALEGEDKIWAQSAYDETVKELTNLLGVNAHCNQVDSGLFDFYSDVYKSENNFRPRFHVTRGEADAWIKEHTTPVEETETA